jgi:hypothetical protein
MSFPAFGDKSAAFRVTIPVTDNGLTLSIYIDIVAVQKGRAFAGVDFEATQTPFDSAMEGQLVGVVVGRLDST